MVDGAFLDRKTHDVLRLFVRLILGLLFDLSDLGLGVLFGFVDEFVDEHLFRLALRHTCDLFEFFDDLGMRAFELLLQGIELGLLLLDLLFGIVQSVRLFVECRFLFVELVLTLDETLLGTVEFRLALLGFAVDFRAEFLLLFFGFYLGFFENGLGFRFRFVPDLFALLLYGADRFACNVSVY